MSEILCPICQRPNDDTSARCWYCQAVLPVSEKPQAGGNTDWLNTLRDESLSEEGPADYSPVTPDGVVENSSDDVPDWLARIRTRENLEKEPEPDLNEEPTEGVEEDLPDWLKEIKAGNSSIKREEQSQVSVQPVELPVSDSNNDNIDAMPAGESIGEDDTQEWLNQLAAWKPATIEEPASLGEESSSIIASDLGEPPANQPLDLDEFSDLEKWLENQSSGGAEQTLPEPEPEAEVVTPIELDPLSGWQKLVPETPELTIEPLTDAIDEQPANSIEPESTELVTTQPEPDHGLLKSSQTDLGGNSDLVFSEEEMSKIAAALPTDHLEAQGDLHTLNGESEAFPDSVPGELEAASTASPFLSGESPEWVANANSQPFLDVDPAFQDALNNLESQPTEKTQLPDWLQAIRTEGEAAPTIPEDKPKTRVEQQGLLAGIQDTLEGAQFDKDFKKPVSYNATLKVSDRQNINAALLAGLIAEKEVEGAVEERKSNQVSRVLWRLAIAILLIGTIIVSNIYFSAFAVKPSIFPPELVASYNTVNAIPADKPVLLVADFDSALSGELNWTGKTMLEHMMLRDLNLVLLSVQPTGSALLVDQLRDANRFVTNYDFASRTTNLGFLAGGTTGLQMAVADIRALLPYTQNLTPAWETPELKDVQDLSDFGAVIVFADQPESARAWVEQVQPQLHDIPLLFVVSAQAAPLLHPYYQSGQVEGFIAGFNGSLAYEQIMQQYGVSSQKIASYQGLMVIITLMVFAGGLASLIRPASTQRKG